MQSVLAKSYQMGAFWSNVGVVYFGHVPIETGGEQAGKQPRASGVVWVTMFALVIAGFFAYRVYGYVDEIRFGATAAERTLGGLSPAMAFSDLALPDGDIDVSSDTANDPVLGASSAAITVVEFGDFGCPYSQESSYVVRALAQKYGDRVRFIYRDFPIVELHPDAPHAAEAGNCAYEQGKFWEYHDKLFAHQDLLGEESLLEYAKQIGLNMGQFRTCLRGGKYRQEVAEDEAAGVLAGVRGTPTFFINGQRIPGSIPFDLMDQIIAETLQSKSL